MQIILNKMKRKLTPLFCAGIFLMGCAQPTPEKLAEDVCQCYTEMKAIDNTTAKLEKVDECFQLTQSKLEKIEAIAKSNDWSDEKKAAERTKFESAVNKCNKSN